MSSITTSTATVPEKMSYVNAFHALWKNSKTASFFKNLPWLAIPQEQLVGTAEKVAAIFKESKNLLFDYVGSRLIRTDFSEFPKLTVTYYDRNYGLGAAQQALDEYNKIPSEKRFDANDSYRFSDLKKLLK